MNKVCLENAQIGILRFYFLKPVIYKSIFLCIKHNIKLCALAVYSSDATIKPKIAKKTRKYKHTILFPSTTFPAYVAGKKRVENEMKLKEIQNFGTQYDQQQKRNTQEYILHDGPPYANGKLHMGHALNKILKDVTIRFKYLKGFRVHYVPGWDCHGLPIELKALEKAQQKKETTGDWDNFDPLQIRSKAKALAKETVEIQRSSFDQWGLFVNWNNHYCTYDKAYISKQLRLFGNIYDKGYIFHSFMPVHFSPSTGSSLAESELEYNENHTSPSLYLALQLQEECALKLSAFFPVYLSIWTTTPWTLPANMAVCIDENKDYFLVEADIGGRQVALVWISDRIQDLQLVLGTPFKVISRIEGSALKSLKYVHPLNGSVCPVLVGSHVSTEKGTGLVHTAPAHGKEDFVVALRNGLSVETNQLIDERGRYKAEAGEFLQGKHVLDDGNDLVIQELRNRLLANPLRSAIILNLGSVVHSYPYDWRTKKPTIIRASQQWFFHISKVKDAALEALKNVAIYPERLRRNFVDLTQGRPYWCISRQRAWGVPIPAFYEADTQKPLISKEIIEHVASLVEKDGSDIWWTHSEEQLLPSDYVNDLKIKGKPLPKKGADILDIWFDSGASWFCSLDGREADLYLEGMDQINGWFQSSLLLSVAATGRAPYKTLFTHGFTVDEHRRKMSKSLRNVFDPDLIVNGGSNLKKTPAYGVNVLRWWALKSTPFKDVPFGLEMVEICEKEVQAIRNAFAFYLGSLNQFNPRSKLRPEQLRPQEQYLLSTVKPFLDNILNYYENFEYDKVPPAVYDFIVEEVGNEYMNSAKDTLYFESEKATRRNSVQTAIYLMLPYLWSSFYPVMPYLAGEAAMHYSKLNGDSDCLDTVEVSPPPEWSELEGVATMQNLIAVRNAFRIRCMEEKPNEKNSLKLKVHLTVGENFADVKLFQASETENHSDLCSLLRVSEVTVSVDPMLPHDFKLDIFDSVGKTCARCRKIFSFKAEICPRCLGVVAARL